MADENHPCFSLEASHGRSRLHLAVAPRCNVRCGFCTRLFDCPNESRPGVVSRLLNIEEALERVRLARVHLPALSVVAVAGPGDALANEESFRTLRLVKEGHPELSLCLSTNGLLLPERLPELLALGLSHLTVTINAAGPEVGAKVYSWVKLGDKLLRGEEGFEALFERQVEGLTLAAGAGLKVKVNMVLIPELNLQEVAPLAELSSQRGAHIFNIMPCVPAPGSPFYGMRPPSILELREARREAAAFLPVMTHCRQCRSDAAGVLGEDWGRLLDRLQFGSEGEAERPVPRPARPFLVAVASREGRAVDQHFGHARDFHIFRADGEGVRFLERRSVPQYCHGVERCGDSEEALEAVGRMLSDCRAILCQRIGADPERYLRGLGLKVIETPLEIGEAIREKVLKDSAREVKDAR